MPKFKIETSLFEPVTIEVEGGRTYVSAPLSPSMIKAVSNLEEQRKAKTLEDMTALTQQVALIFGIDPKEVETTDIRVLSQILEHVTNAMMGAKVGRVPLPEVPGKPADEVVAEKNGPTLGSESTL